MKDAIKIQGIQGLSGGVNSFMGYAPANLLYSCSFVDVLDEKTGVGYQRRFNDRHSLDFRKYIQNADSTTPPLTFNLRPSFSDHWSIETSQGFTTLFIAASKQVLSQVDCQHRLGYLADLDVMLPFIAFIGLTEKQEMAAFNTINSKAKGLPGSLIDFHETKLVTNIEKVKPELVLAVRINDDPSSPWFKKLDLGGNRTSGMQRRASLRTMQKAIRKFIRRLNSSSFPDIESIYQIVLAFWKSVTRVLPMEWEDIRKHMICKGIGVYSLMEIAADIYLEKSDLQNLDWEDFFRIKLSSFIGNIDWSNNGPLRGLGGESGAKEAIQILRASRTGANLRTVKNG